MGIENSKLELATISEDVKKLKAKIKTCNIAIDSYVVDRIVRALQNYEETILSKGRNKHSNLLRVIQEAIEQVKSLHTKTTHVEHGELDAFRTDWNQRLKIIMTDVNKIYNTIKNNDISVKQFDTYIGKIILFSSQLDQVPRPSRTKEIVKANNDITIFFLKLFLKVTFPSTPPVQSNSPISQLFNELVKSINAISKQANNVHPNEKEIRKFALELGPQIGTIDEIINKIKNISDKNAQLKGDDKSQNKQQTHDLSKKRLSSKTSEVKNNQYNHKSETDSKSYASVASTKPTNSNASIQHQNQYKSSNIESILKEQEQSMRNFQGSTKSYKYNQIKDTVTGYKKYLNEMPGNNDHLKMRIERILTELDERARQYEKREQYLKTLEDIDNEISNKRITTSNFQQHEEQLLKYKTIINSMEILDEEMNAKLKEVTNKLENQQEILLSVKSRSLIWEIKDSVQKHQSYIEKTRNLEAYRRQHAELINLNTRVNDIITINYEDKNEKQNLLMEILKMINFLNVKINEESAIDQCLKKLEEIEYEVNNINASNMDSQEKRKALEEYRRQVQPINHPNELVYSKKRKFLEYLRKLIKSDNRLPGQKSNEFRREPNQETRNIDEENRSLDSRRGETSHNEPIILHKTDKIEMRNQEKETPVRTDENDSIQILDLHENFESFNSLSRVENKYSIAFIEEIKKKAESYEDEVRGYRGSDYSLDYLVLDEKMMRLIEELDKIKCQDNPTMLTAKLEVINYIKSLHQVLDNNAKKTQEKVDDSLRYLKNLEHDICAMANSNSEIALKLKNFEEYKTKITDVQESHFEVTREKKSLLDKIKTFHDYFRNIEVLVKIKTALQTLQIRIEDFSYPKSSDEYIRVQSEIFSLSKQLDMIQSENMQIKSEVGNLRKRVKPMFEALDKKAADNEVN